MIIIFSSDYIFCMQHVLLMGFLQWLSEVLQNCSGWLLYLFWAYISIGYCVVIVEEFILNTIWKWMKWGSNRRVEWGLRQIQYKEHISSWVQSKLGEAHWSWWLLADEVCIVLRWGSDFFMSPSGVGKGSLVVMASSGWMFVESWDGDKNSYW